MIVFFVANFLFASNSVNLSMSVVGGQISLGFPANLNLGTINLSQNPENVQGKFDDYFWVSDLAGSDSGYSTTIVCDGLVGNNGTTLTGIYLIAGNNGVPELLLGITGDVRINSAFLGSGHSIFSNPVTYMYRPQGANNGKINKYGDKPSMRIFLPAYTQPGEYSGTIYFDI